MSSLTSESLFFNTITWCYFPCNNFPLIFSDQFCLCKLSIYSFLYISAFLKVALKIPEYDGLDTSILSVLSKLHICDANRDETKVVETKVGAVRHISFFYHRIQ